jgi:hypothetical protein
MELGIIAIRFGVSIVMILFGINQVTKPRGWIDEYVPKFLSRTPLSSNNFMRVHALLNISLGVLFLLGIFGQIGAIITLIWWVSILPFAIYSNWKVGVRDFAIIMAILSVIFLVNG